MIIATRIEIVRFHSFSHLMFFFSEIVKSTAINTAPSTQATEFLLSLIRWDDDIELNAPIIAALEIAISFAGSPPEILCCTKTCCDRFKHNGTDQGKSHPRHRSSNSDQKGKHST